MAAAAFWLKDCWIPLLLPPLDCCCILRASFTTCCPFCQPKSAHGLHAARTSGRKRTRGLVRAPRAGRSNATQKRSNETASLRSESGATTHRVLEKVGHKLALVVVQQAIRAAIALEVGARCHRAGLRQGSRETPCPRLQKRGRMFAIIMFPSAVNKTHTLAILLQIKKHRLQGQDAPD